MTRTETLAASLHLDELVSEIERYLDAVEVFRSEGCEPRWSSGAGIPEEACPDLFERITQEV